jgi:hypothetical protein
MDYRQTERRQGLGQSVGGKTGQDEVHMGLSPVCFLDAYQRLDWKRDRWVGVYCGGGGLTPFGEAYQRVEGGLGGESWWEQEARGVASSTSDAGK